MFNFLKKGPNVDERIALLEKKVSLLERKLKQLSAEVKETEKKGEEKKAEETKAAKEKPAAKDAKKEKSTDTKKKKLSEQEEKKARKEAYYQKKVKEAMTHVVEVTGWDYDHALAQFEEAKARTQCTPKEYFIYRFYDLTKEEQDKVFLADYSKKIIKHYPVSKKFYEMLYDKEKTNEYFPELLGRPWCVNTKIDEEEFVKRFTDTKRIMYKPIAGHRGQGAEAFNLEPETIRDVYKTLAGYPEGVVEGYVIQHPKMATLCPASVNTIRVVTISSNSKPIMKDSDKRADIAYTALRIGGGNSIVDNFHSGGMCVAIDMETGKICTPATDMEGNVFEKHPMTGTEFMGFEIPFYHETMELILKTIREKKIEGYLGWDIAITENGPVLIELNDRPGVVLLSTPYAPMKKGMKYVMEKYM